ncbi:MAG: pyruvate carboxylase [Pelagibacteraceae bacterium]|nr:pyruvate carboxylase [Pelagibacteraceae bacterium]
MKKINKILIANRSEIAIRISRAATELGYKTVSIYSYEDRFALHRFKTDESYLVGSGKGPIEAYLDYKNIVKIAVNSGCDAIHPGYGFLSENPDFVKECQKNNILFIGPNAKVMMALGNKVEAKKIAAKAKVATIPSSGPLPRDLKKCKSLAKEIGYPIMLKASWGGGGRGMRVIRKESDLETQITTARSEAKSAFGKDDVFFEKLIEKAYHVEVQIIGDTFGNLVHLFERDCSLQRRHQKVVERAPAAYLTDSERNNICESGVKIGKQVSYSCAGTVEFLMDVKTRDFFFIEVNPRVQVEHTVTEEITGIDIVKAQFLLASGAKIGDGICGIPEQNQIQMKGHAIQSRVTTEDAENDFAPDYGKISVYRSASGFGIRLDAGAAATGTIITPYYDSLLVKVTAKGQTPFESKKRMDRALREFRLRGVKTNIPFLVKLINHKSFDDFSYHTKFIDTEKNLFKFIKRKDRASKVLSFLSEVIVNGNEEVKNRQPITETVPAKLSDYGISKSRNAKLVNEKTYKQILDDKGPTAVAESVLKEKKLLLTDTTFRDAHQSLIATRMRTEDMLGVTDLYEERLRGLFSVECWGGATFDVALRFLKEDPWMRLEKIREQLPSSLLQMLFRGSNALGYTNYPDNVLKRFIQVSAKSGIDVFRIFDALNWIENMKVSIEEVLKSGKICEATICYSGDLSSNNEAKYTLDYYLKMAEKLEKMGAHFLAIKDMAGLCKPKAAEVLFKELKNNLKIPIHFHTHDTSGNGVATLLSASKAGVDVVDVAIDSWSGFTSQPSFGAILESLDGNKRDPKISSAVVRTAANYWEGVRKNYQPFESKTRTSMSEVYLHQMPGGQYTNLREQARSMGIKDDRWPELASMYSEVNNIFGDVIKVTPISKVVGDMAIYMLANNISIKDVLDSKKDVGFPASVIEFFSGRLGQPYKGFPKSLQKKILKGKKPINYRYGSKIKSLNIKNKNLELEKKYKEDISEKDTLSYIFFPEVFDDYMKHKKRFGDTSVIPTPNYFFGLKAGEEIYISLEPGKTLVIRYFTQSEPNEKGYRTVYFELNGQPRSVDVKDNSISVNDIEKEMADTSKDEHVAAPIPGLLVDVAVTQGIKVQKGSKLCTIEAMKMETVIYSDRSGKIEKLNVKAGDNIEANQLLMVIK